MTYWMMWLFCCEKLDSIPWGRDMGFSVINLFHQAFLGALIICNQPMSGFGLDKLKRVGKSLGLFFRSYFLISSLGSSARMLLYL